MDYFASQQTQPQYNEADEERGGSTMESDIM